MTDETAKWGDLQNVPEAEAVPLNLAAGVAELGRLAALCPHGWVELMVDQGRSPSTPDDPGEGYQDVQAICVWGVGPDIVERLDELIDDATADGSALSKVPAGSFVAIARVVRRDAAHSNGCPCCAEEISLDVGWGIDGAAVYSLPPPDDDAPNVCGGCLAVGAEPHASDCPDERGLVDGTVRAAELDERLVSAYVEGARRFAEIPAPDQVRERDDLGAELDGMWVRMNLAEIAEVERRLKEGADA